MEATAEMNGAAHIESLTHQWKIAKQIEKDAAVRRVAIESSIWAIVQKRLPDKGTTTLETGLKIVTSFAEEWDQEALADAERAWSAPVPFPFETVYKADARAVAYIRERLPEVYASIREALTLKPKKPAFSLSDKD
ncbi:hypothetical protein BH10PLA2_BH10PLA2_19870 [soil metagenome]